VFLGETSRSIQREMKIGTWNVMSLYRAGSLKITLGLISRWDEGIRTGLGWPGIETDGGRFECGNEPSGSVKCGEFLD